MIRIKEAQPSVLKGLFDKVLLDFEEALDKAEDLKSVNLDTRLRRVKKWLENATATLISWGIDVRVDAGSLSSITKTPLENEVASILNDLQSQLHKIYEEITSLPEDAISRSSIHSVEGTSADNDPLVTMSSLIGLLQDTVRPIRMEYASTQREGPYRAMKALIDNMYTERINRRDHSKLQATAHLEGNPSQSRMKITESLSHRPIPFTFYWSTGKCFSTASASGDSNYSVTDRMSFVTWSTGITSMGPALEDIPDDEWDVNFE